MPITPTVTDVSKNVVIFLITLQHFLAGTFAGTVSAAVLYPLDLIKVRYQV